MSLAKQPPYARHYKCACKGDEIRVEAVDDVAALEAEVRMQGWVVARSTGELICPRCVVTRPELPR